MVNEGIQPARPWGQLAMPKSPEWQVFWLSSLRAWLDISNSPFSDLILVINRHPLYNKLFKRPQPGLGIFANLDLVLW